MPVVRRLFLAGQSVSLLGDGLAVLAVPLLVLQLTDEPLAAGLAAAPRGVGYVLVGIPAGPIVDRLDPWLVLIAADVVRAGTFTALPAAALLSAGRLEAVLALAFLAGAATVFFDAALAVAVKDLFGDGNALLGANSTLEAVAQTARLTGPALVGALAATAGMTAALLINAATFGISLLSLLIVKRAGVAATGRRPRRGAVFRGLSTDFADGLRHLGRLRPLLAITVIYALVNLCLAVDTLIVFFARVTLALPTALVGVVVAGGGLGGIAGALMASWFAARVRPLPLIAWGLLVTAGSVVVMGVSTVWWPLLIANIVQLWAVAGVSVVSRSLRQAWTPRDLLGRITTASRALVLTATAVGAVIAGATTSAFGDDPRPVFAGAGALIAVIAGAGWFAALRRYDAGRGYAFCMDWHAWHDQYEHADSSLARRLRVVREKVGSALDGCPPGPVRVISLCAGQGRDLLAVLAEHPRRADVTARLVELDPRNTAVAADFARAAGLDQVDVVTGDAARTDHYRGMVPADIVLVCGLFGNITAADIERTIDTCPELCERGGTVIWTRGRFTPDLIPQICDWFAERGFDLEWLSEPEAGYGVGVHRFTGEPRPLSPGRRLFTFVGRDVLGRREG